LRGFSQINPASEPTKRRRLYPQIKNPLGDEVIMEAMLNLREADEERRASAVVAPLVIKKEHSRTRSNGSRSTSSRHERQSSDRFRRTPSVKSQGQISPPLTPRTSLEKLHIQDVQTVFHHYLRAFCHYHPESTVSSSTNESSITVPINLGDVILVHSIHPNGWADGTLVQSGARGWLPTNYCEPFDPPSMRTLLNALTYLWDLVRLGENGDLAAFAKQDYVRQMIAGVRFLLVSFAFELISSKHLSLMLTTRNIHNA
jgi:hypothetical protein